MYKRILVPLDGSPMGDRVLPYVRNLGKKLDAKVDLFRVFDPEPEFFTPSHSSSKTGKQLRSTTVKKS